MAKFHYKTEKIDDTLVKITFITSFSKLSFNEKFCVAMILASNRFSTADKYWKNSDVVLRSCICVQSIADDIVKVLENSRVNY
jgi:hypothetical protein